jgi:glucose-1-phosphate thymidylyltransferase
MSAVTPDKPKQLIPVANKPILFYGIEALRKAGIRDIGIVVGAARDRVRHLCGKGDRWGVRLAYIEQESPLGLGHAVLVAEPFIGGGPFVLYLGDNIIEKGIEPYVREFREKRPSSVILLSRVPEPSTYGVAELKEGRLLRIVEKPDKPVSDLAVVGVYLFDGLVFEAVKSVRPSPRNELEIADALQYLIDNGSEVIPRLVTGWWKDIGTIEDVIEANRLVLAGISTAVRGEVDPESVVGGSVVVESGARIRASRIHGPVVVGADAEIVGSAVGPFVSVGPKCRIIRAEIKDSVLMEGSVILEPEEPIEECLTEGETRIFKAQGKRGPDGIRE